MRAIHRHCFILALLFAAIIKGGPAMAAEGLIVKPSPHSPKETLDRLDKILTAKGITVFARIDHAAGAAFLAISSKGSRTASMAAFWAGDTGSIGARGP